MPTSFEAIESPNSCVRRSLRDDLSTPVLQIWRCHGGGKEMDILQGKAFNYALLKRPVAVPS